jgi:hypothetical protein
MSKFCCQWTLRYTQSTTSKVSTSVSPEDPSRMSLLRLTANPWPSLRSTASCGWYLRTSNAISRNLTPQPSLVRKAPFFKLSGAEMTRSWLLGAPSSSSSALSGIFYSEFPEYKYRTLATTRYHLVILMRALLLLLPKWTGYAFLVKTYAI